jgi:hypothetical protein
MLLAVPGVHKRKGFFLDGGFATMEWRSNRSVAS